MPFVSRTPKQALFLALLLLVPGLQGCDGSKKQVLLPATPMSRTLTQTLESVTVTVNVVNVDAHRVVLDLTLDGPAQPYGYALELTWIYAPQIDGPTLTAGGKELPFLPQAGDGMISGAQTPDGLPLFSQGMIAFDASDLQWDQPRVPLHLSLPLLVNNEPFVPPLPVPTGTIPATSTPTQVPPISHIITFDFTFDVAYDARQVVLEPRQEVESNGVKMTLERIDVTASEALVSVRYSETRPDTFLNMVWVAFATLLVGPGNDEHRLTLSGEPDWDCGAGLDTNEFVFSFVLPTLIDVVPVDCTLLISAGEPSPKHIGIGGSSPPPLGDWVFQFTAPASTGK